MGTKAKNKLNSNNERIGYWEIERDIVDKDTYNVSKVIDKRGHYVNGYKHGYWEEFTTHGVLFREFNYNMGLKIGVEIHNNSSGLLSFKFTRDNNGKLIKLEDHNQVYFTIERDGERIIKYSDCCGNWYHESQINTPFPYEPEDNLSIFYDIKLKNYLESIK